MVNLHFGKMSAIGTLALVIGLGADGHKYNTLKHINNLEVQLLTTRTAIKYVKETQERGYKTGQEHEEQKHTIDLDYLTTTETDLQNSIKLLKESIQSYGPFEYLRPMRYLSEKNESA